jgi:hypothetical protein
MSEKFLGGHFGRVADPPLRVKRNRRGGFHGRQGNRLTAPVASVSHRVCCSGWSVAPTAARARASVCHPVGLQALAPGQKPIQTTAAVLEAQDKAALGHEGLLFSARCVVIFIHHTESDVGVARRCSGRSLPREQDLRQAARRPHVRLGPDDRFLRSWDEAAHRRPAQDTGGWER